MRKTKRNNILMKFSRCFYYDRLVYCSSTERHQFKLYATQDDFFKPYNLVNFSNFIKLLCIYVLRIIIIKK